MMVCVKEQNRTEKEDDDDDRFLRNSITEMKMMMPVELSQKIRTEI